MFRAENERFVRQSQNRELGVGSNQRGKLKDMQFNWKVGLPENGTARIGMFEPSFQHSSEEEQGICFVFRNYVYGDPSLSSGSNEKNEEAGMFGYLPAIFERERETVHACLMDSVIALGLAGICNTKRNVPLMKRAVVKYTSAVKGISALLPLVDQATRDEVLIAVLLLGLYEVS
jgi:hypothetical protein